MEIIKVQNDDQLSITAKLADEIWRQHFHGIISVAQIDYMLDKFQSFAAMQGQIAKENYNYFLIKDDNGVFQGYFAVAPNDKHLFLSKIYIRKDSRGKGYAGKSIDFMKDFAKELSLPSIVLTVNKDNGSAIAAYKKIGFKVIDEVKKDIDNGFFMDDYIMEIEV